MEAVIVAALLAHPLVLKEPAPTVVLQEIQEYTLQMTARAVVRSADYWKALYGLQKDVTVALARADILMPVTRQAAVVRNEPLSDITRPLQEAAPPPKG